jgi:hypothetical protein
LNNLQTRQTKRSGLIKAGQAQLLSNRQDNGKQSAHQAFLNGTNGMAGKLNGQTGGCQALFTE